MKKSLLTSVATTGFALTLFGVELDAAHVEDYPGSSAQFEPQVVFQAEAVTAPSAPAAEPAGESIPDYPKSSANFTPTVTFQAPELVDSAKSGARSKPR